MQVKVSGALLAVEQDAHPGAAGVPVLFLHANVAETVDALLRGFAAPPEVRQLGRGGRIEIVDEVEAPEGSRRIDRGSTIYTWELGTAPNRRAGGHVVHASRRP